MAGRFRARITLWRAIGAVLLAAAVWAAVVRFARGLGAATHLSDGFPWGLWIGFDVLVGVGLAAGGFVVATTVHIFRIEKYTPIARPTILTAFLGYLLVIVALLFDLGRPSRIWHPLVMWNPHSVMFEVAWCVTLYTSVLALEFSPLVLERLGWKRPQRWLKAMFLPLVIGGVLLSTLHQSSLGTLYVIAPDKLHGLWYTPLLPVFFFITAIAAGLAMTIFESTMSRRAFGKQLEQELLDGISRVIVVALAVYAVWKLQDLVNRGNLGLAFALTPESVLFWGEVGLGVVLPMILFALPFIRRDPQMRFFAAVLTVMGFVINRLNVAVTGMQGAASARYLPSMFEFAVTMGLVAAGFAMFGAAVKYLPVFPPAKRAEDEGGGEANPVGRTGSPMLAMRGSALICLWGLLVVGAVGLALATHHTNGTVVLGAAADSTVEAVTPGGVQAAALEIPGPHTFHSSEDSPGAVTFRHETHVDPGRPQCSECHAKLFSLLEPGRPKSGAPNGDRMHQELCGSCHQGTRAFAIAEACDACHVPSMQLTGE
jgi:c(7)-type cytochrome triheme protein